MALQALKFPHKVIIRIWTCISSASFSFKLNEGLVGFSKSSRGLRQGDPISPYLSTLVMEVLSSMLRLRSTEKNLRFHRRCKKQGITHICLANDFLLFCKGDPKVVELMRDGLADFSSQSGLQPNARKLICFSVGCESSVQEPDSCIARISGGMSTNKLSRHSHYFLET